MFYQDIQALLMSDPDDNTSWEFNSDEAIEEFEAIEEAEHLAKLDLQKEN